MPNFGATPKHQAEKTSIAFGPYRFGSLLIKHMRILFVVLVAVLCSCQNPTPTPIKEGSPIIGTWELISATTIQGDSTHYKDLSHTRMIKIFNASHFAFFNHDRNKGQDSLNVFVAGGGSYQLEQEKYTEFLTYCNYREWEGNRFEFDLEFKGDTLIQNGVEEIAELGVNRRIIEVYVKTKD